MNNLSDVQGPGYLDYGSDAYMELLDRLCVLANSGQDFFVVSDDAKHFISQIDDLSANTARHAKSFASSYSLKSAAQAWKLVGALRKDGITDVVLHMCETKDRWFEMVFAKVPGLTVHHLRELTYQGKGITKRNITSNGEALPDGVYLLAEALYEQGGISEIPVEAFYGKAGEIAYQLETPLGFAYPAVLTAACGAGIEASGTIRPTLYTSLLGPVGAGKSVTLTRVIDLFVPDKGFDGTEGDIRDPRNIMDVAASDQGLYRVLADAKGQARFINLDEGRNMLLKAGIEGSSLAPVLCQLFNMNYAGGADKKSKYSICVKLSMLLNIKVTEDAR